MSIELEKDLELGSDYSISVKNVTAGANENDVISSTLTLENEGLKTFSTKPYRVFADNLILSDINGETSKISDGSYSIKMNFCNESKDDLYPVMFAGLYNSDNKLEKLFTKEFEVKKEDLSEDISMDIIIEDSQDKTLKIFVAKDKKDLSPVSSLYTFDIIGCNQPETYDSEKKIYDGSVEHINKIDGNTYKITTILKNVPQIAGREAIVLLLKEGKTVEDINFVNPMDTILTTDFFTVSENGVSSIIPDAKGNYPSYIYVSNCEKHSESIVEYFGKAFFDAGLLIVKDITASEVNDFLNNYEKALSIDLTEYNQLIENEEIKQKTTVAQSVEALKNEKENKKFESYDEFFVAFYKAIEFAAEKGILNGRDDGTFDPTAKVTRAELAVIITKIAEDKGIKLADAGVDYDDVDDGGAAKAHVEAVMKEVGEL